MAAVLSKRWLWFISIVVFIGLALLLAVSLVSQWRANLSATALYIGAGDISTSASNTSPIVVDVYIDGNLVARGVRGRDIPVFSVKPGSHTIEVRAMGYRPYSQTVSASSDGGEAYVYALMHPK